MLISPVTSRAKVENSVNGMNIFVQLWVQCQSIPPKAKPREEKVCCFWGIFGQVVTPGQVEGDISCVALARLQML